MKPAIVWFRQDLRLADNPALAAATATGKPIVCLYVLDDASADPWRMGGASRWWLHHSLQRLEAALCEIGGRLVLRRGNAGKVVVATAKAYGADAVYWNRCYEPFAIARDSRIKSALTGMGVRAESSNGSLLCEPWEITTATGSPYRVFTPFWRSVLVKAKPALALPTPTAITPGPTQLASDTLDAWELRPSKPDWAAGLRNSWQPGEAGAQTRLAAFVAKLDGYRAGRDLPAADATSRLSPHLHFGEISPRQIWHAVRHACDDVNADKFLSELGWREFAHHLLFHFPLLTDEPLDPKFANFPWRDDGDALHAWRRGRTGIPIVDAGMRELWHTGWMHNRVRMIAASFLIKHLGIDWRRGQAWFWDTLVDADLANNAASWQWVAGCGADAAPFFRIFNPVLQGEKFDADGRYVRRWVPELAGLPDRWLHQPWEAPAHMRETVKSYPHPIVDLAQGRARALQTFQSLKAP